MTLTIGKMWKPSLGNWDKDLSIFELPEVGWNKEPIMNINF